MLLIKKSPQNYLFKKKPRNADVWPLNANFRVDYSERDGKWYYNYSNLSLEFKVNWDKKIFNTVYTLSSEMVITDWVENKTFDSPKKKEFLKPTAKNLSVKVNYILGYIE